MRRRWSTPKGRGGARAHRELQGGDRARQGLSFAGWLPGMGALRPLRPAMASPRRGAHGEVRGSRERTVRGEARPGVGGEAGARAGTGDATVTCRAPPAGLAHPRRRPGPGGACCPRPRVAPVGAEERRDALPFVAAVAWGRRSPSSAPCHPC